MALTAAHCTGETGIVTDTVFYQGGQVIGREKVDPPYNYFPCPANKRCRRSDAALIDLVTSNYTFAAIAYTADPQPTSGSINRFSPDIPVTNWLRIPFVDPYPGQKVAKVGQHSGWTYGEVTNGCVAVSVGPVDHYPCSVLANYGSSPGDSGAPVYTYSSPNVHDSVSDGAFLLGIHFAGNSDVKAFSSWYAIEWDFGGKLKPK